MPHDQPLLTPEEIADFSATLPGEGDTADFAAIGEPIELPRVPRKAGVAFSGFAFGAGGEARPPVAISGPVIHEQRLSHTRDQTSITQGILDIVRDRGFSAVFINEFTGADRDDQRRMMGDLLLTDPRKENLGQWWERLKATKGGFETLARRSTPFVSDIMDAIEADKLLLAAERFERGTDDNLDRLRLMSFIIDGKSIPEGIVAQAGQIGFGSIGFMLEIMATKGAFTAGRAAGKATLGRVLRGLTTAKIPLTKFTVRSAAIEIGGVMAGSALQAPVADFMGIRANALHRMIPGFTVDEAGELALLFEEADDEFEALWGAAIDSYIEFVSERSGGLLGVGAQAITRAAAKFGLKSAMVNTFVRGLGKGTSGRFPKLVNEAIRDSAFNGIAAEIFEERFGDILRLASGEATWEELVERNSDWRNWAAEALAFAVLPVAASTAGVGLKIIEGTATALKDQSAQRFERKFGISESDLARQNILDTTSRVPVEPTQLQVRAQAIADAGGSPAEVIERDFLLERGGPYTVEERDFLDFTDAATIAQPPGQLSHEEMASRPREERDEQMQQLQDIVQSQTAPDGTTMSSDDPRLAQARRSLASLMRIQRQEGEVSFALPAEPVIPQPDAGLEIVAQEKPRPTTEEIVSKAQEQLAIQIPQEEEGKPLTQDLVERGERLGEISTAVAEAATFAQQDTPEDEDKAAESIQRALRLARDPAAFAGDEGAAASEQVVSALTPLRRTFPGSFTEGAPSLIRTEQLSAVRDFIIENEGVTYEPFGEVFENSGYVVSRYPQWEQALPPGVLITAEVIDAYLKLHAEFFANNPRARLGGWYDKETQQYVLDIAEIYENSDEGREQALDVARTAAQKAIFHLDTLETIFVFGSHEEWVAARREAGLSPPSDFDPDSREDEPSREETSADADQRLAEDHELTGNVLDFFTNVYSFELIFSLAEIKANPAFDADSQEGRILRARAFLITRGHNSNIAIVEPDAGSPHFILMEGMKKIGVTLEFISGAEGLLGLHDPLTQSIMIQIDTESEQAMRQTFTHEWVHFLKSTRRSAWERFRQRIRKADMNGLRLAGLDYYKRLHPQKVDWDKFMLWFETPLGQNEAVSVYVDQRMETTGFYDLILKRDMRTFELFREKLGQMIAVLDTAPEAELDERHADIEVLKSIKELADSFFDQTQAESDLMDRLEDLELELRGPESHSEILNAGMRAMKSITRAQFEGSGLIAKPWVDIEDAEKFPEEGAISHREAKQNPELAQFWAVEMQKSIADGRPASKEIIRVSSKLAAADAIMQSRRDVKKTFEGRDDLQSPLVIMMTEREELDMTATGKRGKFKGSDIARALDKRARKLGNVVRFNDKGKREYTGKQRERIIQSLMEEIQLGFASGVYNGVGWYDESIKDMIHWVAKDFPELEISDSHAAIFKLLVAVTSNGNTVRRNYQAAKRIYAAWSASADKITVTGNGRSAEAPRWGTGTFATVNHDPADIDNDLIPLSSRTKLPPGQVAITEAEKGGTLWSRRGWPMRSEMRRLNVWMKLKQFDDGSGTPAAFIAWLLEPMSVGEIRSDGIIGKKFAVADESVGLKNRRALYLGPKVGAFFQNMLGIHDLLTMDVWFARTWNRLTGTLMLAPTAKKKAVNRAWNQIKELGAGLFVQEETRFGFDVVVAEARVAIQWALQANRQIQQRNGQRVHPDLKKAVEAMVSASDGVISAPGTGAERARIREVFAEVQERLKAYGRTHRIPQLRNLQMSDIQAILWYNEQSFWNSFGVSKAQTASEDYGTAAKRDFQESSAAAGHTDAETAIFVGGGRLPDGRGRGGVTAGAGRSDARRTAVEDGLEGAIRRRDGGIDLDLAVARQRLIDSGYAADDASELVTRAVIDVTDTTTRKISVVIDALAKLPDKSLTAGLDLLSGRKPVTGTQQALFVDPPVVRTTQKRRTPGPKMGPAEQKALRSSLRLQEKGRKEGKRQGVAAATQRVVGIVESIFGKQPGTATAGAVKALARALKARTPEQATLAAVALIRSHAQIERQRLQKAEKARRDTVRAEGRQETREARQEARNKASDLQLVKETILRVIQASGLPKKVRGTFNADLVAASTRQAIGRALKKIDRLAAQVRFVEAVSKFNSAQASAKRAGRKTLSNVDRAQIRKWLDDARPSIFIEGARPRSFDDAAGYDNASSIATASTEMVQELLATRKAEKRKRGQEVKTTRDEDVNQILTHLGWNPDTGKFDKEIKKSKRETEFENRERSLASRGFSLQLYYDTESMTRKAESRWKGDGVLTRLISRRMKEVEEDYNSELRDETKVVEQLLKEAGFRNISHAFQRLMGTFGKTSTEFVDVTLQGEAMKITLDEALEFLALDENTLAKIAEGRPVKLRNMSQRLKLVVTIEEVEAIRQQLEPKYGDLVRAMKARLETNLRPRLFEVLMRLKGAEPELIPNYWPTSVDVNATDNAGLAKAYREGGGFGAIRQRYLENLGFTKDREENADSPFVMNGLLARYISHMDQALKIIHMSEAARDASAVLLDQNVADAINRTSGSKVYRSLQTMLIEASLVGRDTIPGGTNWLQVVNSGVATSYILTNPGTFIRQLGGIPKLWNEMPTGVFAKGLAIAATTRGTLKEMQDNSGFFYSRYSGDTMSRYSPVAGSGLDGLDNIAFTQGLGAFLNAGVHGDFKGAGRSWNRMLRSIKFLDYFDAISARIAWEGFKAQGKSQGLSGKELMVFTSRRAGMAVRSSQNTSSPLDAGAVVMNTRDSMWRYFFLFTTDPMKSLNQLVQGFHDSPAKAVKASVGVFGNIIWSAYATNFIIEAGSELLGTMLASAFGDDPDEQLRKDRILRAWYKMHFRAMNDTLGLVPVIGDAFAGTVEFMFKQFQQSDVLEPIVFEAINDIASGMATELRKALVAIPEEEWGDFWEHMALTTWELAAGAAKLVGDPTLMPRYRARRILEPAQDILPDPINKILGFEESTPSQGQF